MSPKERKEKIQQTRSLEEALRKSPMKGLHRHVSKLLSSPTQALEKLRAKKKNNRFEIEESREGEASQKEIKQEENSASRHYS